MSSKEHQPGDQAAEIAALRSQLAESKRENAESREQMAELSRKLDALASQRNYQGDQQQVVNVNLPDQKEALDKKQAEAIDKFDATQARAELTLFEGPRHFRVCVIDAENMKRHLGDRSANVINEPWNWKFNPFNPWRVVGANDREHAQRKYAAYFGITGFMEGEERNRYVVYECDAQGERLEAVAV